LVQAFSTSWPKYTAHPLPGIGSYLRIGVLSNAGQGPASQATLKGFFLAKSPGLWPGLHKQAGR
jgi:hypothetical protein